jgi:hypothetical protein
VGHEETIVLADDCAFDKGRVEGFEAIRVDALVPLSHRPHLLCCRWAHSSSEGKCNGSSSGGSEDKVQFKVC